MMQIQDNLTEAMTVMREFDWLINSFVLVRTLAHSDFSVVLYELNFVLFPRIFMSIIIGKRCQHHGSLYLIQFNQMIWHRC